MERDRILDAEAERLATTFEAEVDVLVMCVMTSDDDSAQVVVYNGSESVAVSMYSAQWPLTSSSAAGKNVAATSVVDRASCTLSVGGGGGCCATGAELGGGGTSSSASSTSGGRVDCDMASRRGLTV